MTGFSFNKALGAGVSSGVLTTFLPALMGLLHWVQPVAGAVNPLFGGAVGLLVAGLTWLTPKNAEPSP